MSGQWQHNGYMGGTDMRHNLSTDSTSSHSGMSSVATHSTGSPYRHGGSYAGSYDGGSPLPEEMLFASDHYSSFSTQPDQAHAFTNDHLALSNPNGVLPYDQWLSPLSYSRGRHQSLQSPSTDDAAFQLPEDNFRYTPQSLGWSPGTPLLQLYTLVVNKGKDPYFELFPGAGITEKTPERVYLGDCSTTQEKSFECKYPSRTPCVDKRGRPLCFNRSADLARHYLIVHTPKAQQDTLICGRPNCNRDSDDPFTRKDHYRDHLREYHAEDLGKAKRKRTDTDSTWEEKQKIWLRERKISSRTWRCEKCLVNNRTAKGWICVACKTPCREERRQARIKKAEEEKAEARLRGFGGSSGGKGKSAHGGSGVSGAACETCNGAGFLETDIPCEVDLCPDCQGHGQDQDQDHLGAVAGVGLGLGLGLDLGFPDRDVVDPYPFISSRGMNSFIS